MTQINSNYGRIKAWPGEAPTQTSINRSEVSRALAKAIAYKNCGKDLEAMEWARKLVIQLQCADILGEDQAFVDKSSVADRMGVSHV